MFQDCSQLQCHASPCSFSAKLAEVVAVTEWSSAWAVRSAGRAEQTLLRSAWCFRQKPNRTAHVLTQQVLSPCGHIHASALQTAACTGLGEAAACSSYLYLPVTPYKRAPATAAMQESTCHCSHAYSTDSSSPNHGDSHASSRERLIHSFIHSCPPTALPDSSLHPSAVAGGGFWVLSACAEHKGNSCWQRMGLVGWGALSTGQNGAGQFSALCLVKKDI